MLRRAGLDVATWYAWLAYQAAYEGELSATVGRLMMSDGQPTADESQRLQSEDTGWRFPEPLAAAVMALRGRYREETRDPVRQRRRPRRDLWLAIRPYLERTGTVTMYVIRYPAPIYWLVPPERALVCTGTESDGGEGQMQATIAAVAALARLAPERVGTPAAGTPDATPLGNLRDRLLRGAARWDTADAVNDRRLAAADENVPTAAARHGLLEGSAAAQAQGPNGQEPPSREAAEAMAVAAWDSKWAASPPSSGARDEYLLFFIAACNTTLRQLHAPLEPVDVTQIGRTLDELRQGFGLPDLEVPAYASTLTACGGYHLPSEEPFLLLFLPDDSILACKSLVPGSSRQPADQAQWANRQLWMLESSQVRFAAPS